MPANLENSAVATGLEKVSFHSNSKERQCQRMLKLPHNFTHLTRYSKFSKPGFSNTWTVNFHMFKLVLEKAEEPEINLPTSTGSLKKQENSRKTSTSALLIMWKPLIVWILQKMGIPDHLTYLLRNLYAGQEATVRNGHEQQTGSKLGKEYIKAVYCYLAYLTYMQSISCEMLGWMKRKL